MDKIRRKRRERCPQTKIGREFVRQPPQRQDRHLTIDEAVPETSTASCSYRIAVIDESVPFPFEFSPGAHFMLGLKTAIARTADEYSKARAIFTWMQENIDYDHKKLSGTYKTAREVFISGQGVCGEMAYLYITMARCAGLKSNYVEVDRDCTGKDVSHACAVVYPGQQEVFVDPAYHLFGIRHNTYRILDDHEMFKRFLDVRQRDPLAVPPPVQKKKGFLEWLLEG